MNITEKLYVTNWDAWRAWLKKHHDSKKEVWLIYYKKHTGKPRIPYNDAVEEAVCYGWIDSTVKRVDDEIYVQKFTPRREKSQWSVLNKQRAEKMIREGKMTDAGLAKLKNVLENHFKPVKGKPQKKRLVIPPDLKKALAADEKARENFNNFAPSYKRQYIGWIASAKREETRKKRLAQTVRFAVQNRKLGMV